MEKSSKPRRKRVINIMGTKVKVRYTSKVLYDGDEELHGAFYADTMTVFVSNKSAVHDTLCHELFHAFLAISGYNQGMSAATEEGLTRAFEHAFSKYLKF